MLRINGHRSLFLYLKFVQPVIKYFRKVAPKIIDCPFLVTTGGAPTLQILPHIFDAEIPHIISILKMDQ